MSRFPLKVIVAALLLAASFSIACSGGHQIKQVAPANSDSSASCKTDADCPAGTTCQQISTCPPDAPDSCEGFVLRCQPPPPPK